MDKSEIYNGNIKALKEKHPQIYEILKDSKPAYPYPYKKIINPQWEINISVEVPGTTGVLYYDESEKGIMADAVETLSSQTLKRNDLLMCIGIGLGYIPLAAAKTYPDIPKIVIIEPSIEAFEMAISMVDLTELFRYEKLEIYLEKATSPSRLVINHAEDFYIGICRRITHLPSRLIFGDKIICLENEINETINYMLTGWNTSRNFGETINDNGIHNLISLFNSITIDRLKDKFTNTPAIIVASGPSLEKDLDTIKQIEDKALILACDSSVRPLVDKNIIPHMFFSVDHKKMNFDKIKYDLDELRDSIFVYWMDTNIDSVRSFPGNRRVAVMSSNVFLNTIIRSILGYSFNLPGSVTSNSDIAVLTASYLGCNPIIVAGMDLAFSHGKDHTSGTVVKNHLNKKKLTLVEGLKGYPLYSIIPMVSGRIAFEKNIQIHDNEFIDVSLSGAFINGTKIKSLKEIRDTYLIKNHNFNDIIKQIDWTPSIDHKKVDKIMAKVIQLFKYLEENAKKQLVDVCSLKISMKKINKKQAIEKVQKSLDRLNQFKAKNKVGIILVNNYHNKDKLDIDKRVANIGLSEEMTIETLNHEALSIQIKFYRSIYIAARKAKIQLDSKNTYCNRITGIKEDIKEGNDKNKEILLLARQHAKEGMVWLAEKAYMSYLSDINVNDNEGAFSELIELYIEMRLYKKAINLVKYMEGKLKGNYNFEDIKLKVKQCTDNILESAKSKIHSEQCEDAKLNEASREIIEVLSVFPNDKLANELSEALKTIDSQKKKELISETEIIPSEKESHFLEEKAKLFIDRGENEKAIGIYIGLIENYPYKENIYNRCIGDLRFEEGDYKSALWHYNKGIRKFQEDKQLYNRIRFAAPFINATSIDFETNKNTTIIIIIDNLADINYQRNEQMPKVLSASNEIYFLCCSNEIKKAVDQIIRPLSGTKTQINTVVNTSLISSVNDIIKNSNGSAVLLMDYRSIGYYKKMAAVIPVAKKNKSIGLINIFSSNNVSIQKDGNRKTNSNHIHDSLPIRDHELIVAFRRDLLIKVGMFDEYFGNNISEACYDLRLRSDMEGFKSSIIMEESLYHTNYVGDQITPEFSEKWSDNSMPLNFKRKYEINRICSSALELLRKGEIEKTINQLVNGIKKYAECDLFYRVIAQILITEKRYKEAIEALDEIPESAKNMRLHIFQGYKNIWDSQTLRAYAMFYINEKDKAAEIAKSVLAISPQASKMHTLLGMISLSENGWGCKDSKRYFVEAIRHNRDFELPWFYLSEIIKHSKGDENKAYKLLRRAFFCNPENFNIANKYYEYGLHHNYCEDVISNIENAINIYSANKHLNFLLIDLMIKSKYYNRAMGHIEKCIVLFGKEDGIIDAALSIRNQLGPEIYHGKQKKTAVVNIDSEIDNLEIFLYELKSITNRIDFVDTGKFPDSRNIAAIFGASIISENSTNTNSYEWEFKHNDILNWLEETGKTAVCSCV